MTKGVLFDFYGTLARAVAWGETHEQAFTRHGLAYDEEVWTDRWVGGAIDGEEHVGHSVSRDHYQAWELDRLRQRARAAGVGDDDLEALVGDLYAASKAFTLEAYDEVPSVLATLRARGLTVAVCSNWDWDLDRAIQASDLAELIDAAVTSAQAGTRKPNPRIFAHTLDKVGLSAGDVLFVGDTWGADVEGPLAVGMRAAHLVRRDRRPEPGGLSPLPKGVQRISNLEAVLDLV